EGEGQGECAGQVPGLVLKDDQRAAHIWLASLKVGGDLRIGIEVFESDFIGKPAGKEKSVNPGSPLMVITSEEDRGLLELAEVSAVHGVALVVVLNQIALANVLIRCLEEDRV